MQEQALYPNKYTSKYALAEEKRHRDVMRVARERHTTLTYNCDKCFVAYREAMARILPLPLAAFVYQMARQDRAPWCPSGFYWHCKCCMADRPKIAEFVKNFKRPRTE